MGTSSDHSIQLSAILDLAGQIPAELNKDKKYMRATDQSSLELAYEEARNIVDDPHVHENIIQNALHLIASINNVANVPPAPSIIDNSLLQEARKSLGVAPR